METYVDMHGRERMQNPQPKKHKDCTPLKVSQRGGAFEVSEPEEVASYQRIGFPLVTIEYFMYGPSTLPEDHDVPYGKSNDMQWKPYSYRMMTRTSTPIYKVLFPKYEATFKKIWDIRVEPTTEVDDAERDAMRAHYDRMAPKKETVYPDVPAECDRPDPYNFYQRTRANDGYKAIPRVYGDDFKRMFKSEHYKGNPQHQTEFDFSEFAEKDGEIDYLGIGPEGKGKTKNEKAYWIGKVYIENIRNGRRKNGLVSEEVCKYFAVSERTVYNHSKFADACDMLAEDGDGSKVANTIRKRAIASAVIMSKEEFNWGLKDFPYGKRPKPWENFDGERGYAAKEAALRM